MDGKHPGVGSQEPGFEDQLCPLVALGPRAGHSLLRASGVPSAAGIAEPSGNSMVSPGPAARYGPP